MILVKSQLIYNAESGAYVCFGINDKRLPRPCFPHYVNLVAFSWELTEMYLHYNLCMRNNSTTRPTILQFRSLEIGRSANFMQFKMSIDVF